MMCVAVFVAAALLLSSSVAIAGGAGDRAKFTKHMATLGQYKCGRPQPRVFELEDVFDEETLDDLTSRGLRESIYPAVTVLHRCDSTGCCREADERCTASVKANVTLTFAVVGRSLHYHKVTVEDHKHCVCKSTADSIK